MTGGICWKMECETRSDEESRIPPWYLGSRLESGFVSGKQQPDLNRPGMFVSDISDIQAGRIGPGLQERDLSRQRNQHVYSRCLKP